METWKPIPGYDGYEASDLGRIRSTDRMVARSMLRRGQERFESPILRRGQVLRGWLNGTVRVRPGSDRKERPVGQLVLETFVGPRPPGLEMCHRDDDPWNNALSNLYWGTSSQNKYDLVRNGNHGSARKTHCKRGHPLSGEGSNVYLKKNGGRQCNTCRNELRRERPTVRCSPTQAACRR